jgi:UDP-N-acetylglucosamine 2-epimerase (non-hydrolysing)
MIKKLKIATIVGTRPEIIRLSRIMAKLDHHCDHVCIHTGQNFDTNLSDIFFDQLGLKKPSFQLACAGKTPIQTIANILVGVDEVLEQVKPDAVVVLGDTNSCLSVLAAKKRKIPIFHLEAGNRSFDFRVPEEINRRIVDQLSDINLTYSAIAREHLIKENFRQDMVIKIGSPLKEVAAYYQEAITLSPIIKDLALISKEYFLVSIHREENVDSCANIGAVCDILNTVANKYKKTIIFSCHPRTRKRLDELGVNLNPLVILCEPFGYLDYIKLQIEAFCVLSDSGSVNEEASIFNLTAVNLRESSERPEAMEEAVTIMSGLNVNHVMSSIETTVDMHDKTFPEKVADYEVVNVSDKVVKIIHSYIHVIERETWKFAKKNNGHL